jgi:hypothetical protein
MYVYVCVHGDAQCSAAQAQAQGHKLHIHTHAHTSYVLRLSALSNVGMLKGETTRTRCLDGASRWAVGQSDKWANGDL